MKSIIKTKVTANTEVSEAYADWEKTVGDRGLFAVFINKLGDDPYGVVTGDLLVQAVEQMSQNKIEPNHFQLGNLLSALIANNNWKKFVTNKDSSYCLASLLLTDMLRSQNAESELRQVPWDILHRWVQEPMISIPNNPIPYMAEKLFGETWVVLYADSISTNFSGNLQLIENSQPALVVANAVTENTENHELPDNMAP